MVWNIIRIIKFPSAPDKETAKQKDIQGWRKSRCAKCVSTMGWEVTRTQHCSAEFSNYYSSIPSSVHKQRAHNLLHYPSVAMTLYKKADRGFLLY